ncbi:hypothetical protein I6F53_18600 [Pseudoalteromonas sp. SWN29]|uniref:hypothetical protein n=1 Tax=Pseudoalteromonas sp. SWN29 TaxID=2792064 RepID=UPI0018CF6B97|nr:hypothetical protein [Pseudoalteromonas sp. SWN29]MBH0028977.1 hypothetical protein [Pseudoalteromonas sp. SWN29]
MKEQRKIAFYVNAGQAIGFGHIMRQLALIEAALLQNYQIVLFAHDIAPTVLKRLYLLPIKIVLLEGKCLTTQLHNTEALVIDDYHLTESNFVNLKQSVSCIVLFDDNTYEPTLAVDLIVNPSDAFESKHNASIILQGLSYRLIRQEFLLQSHTTFRKSGRVLVCLGGTDVKMLSAKICHALLSHSAVEHIDVLATNSMAKQTLEELKNLSACNRITLHLDAMNVAVIMAQADISIAGAGGSLYELLYLGVPTLALVMADNQQQALLSPLCGTAYIGLDLRNSVQSIENITHQALLLLQSADKKSNLRQVANESLDGKAATRILDAINRLIVKNNNDSI